MVGLLIGGAALALLTFLEWRRGQASPENQPIAADWRREWLAHIGLVLIGGLLAIPLRQFFPTPVPVSWLPSWMLWPVGFLLLEALLYAQHRAMHGVPWLWRLHKVHHGVGALHASAGLRFHPLELLLSTALKLGLVTLLGLPALLLLTYELGVLVLALWSHSAVATTTPRWLDQLLVTPRFHAIHHHEGAPARHFAALLPIFDRLFGSAAHHREHAVGAQAFVGQYALKTLLLQPFTDFQPEPPRREPVERFSASGRAL
jgi:sterol desaturase/sphingolipid hydroxylase (fatty acid hydroxylase superfamily)